MTDLPTQSTTTSQSAYLPTAIVAFVFLSSIAAIRFATLDDRWYAAWVWRGSWIDTAYQIAEVHGRFPRLSTYSYYFPYLIDGAVFEAGLRLGAILLGALLAGNVLRRAFPTRGVAVLFVLFFFAFAQNSDLHNLFVAYPFAWEFSWICWMAGLLGLMVSIARQSFWFAFAGAAIWIVGLQEGFIPQTLIFFVVVLASSGAGQKRWRYLCPYLAGLAAWLLVWILWRAAHPSNYDGAQLGLDAPLEDIARTVVTFSIGGMPLATLLQGDWSASWKALREGIDALSIIKSVAVLIGVRRLLALSAKQGSPDDPMRTALVSIVLLVLAFLPNVLIALTPKYQEWVRLGSHAYLYSHFSYYAWIGLGSLCVVVLVRQRPSRLLIMCFALASALGSLLTDASNFEVTRRQEQFSRRWDTMDAMMRSEAFSKVPDAAGIWFKDSSVSGSESGDAEYWQYVIAARTRKNVLITPDLGAARMAGGGAYYLYLYDEVTTDNQYALLAPLESSQSASAATTRRVYIFPNTSNPSIQVGGVTTCSLPECAMSVVANSHPSAVLFESAFVTLTSPKLDDFGVPVVDIVMSKDALAQTLWVDFARNPVDLAAPVSVFPAVGFEGWQSDGTVRWNWAVAEAELHVRNELDASISLQLEFWVVVGEAQTIVVLTNSGIELARLEPDATHPGFARFPLNVAKGITALKLRSDAPPLNGDGARNLVFQLRDLGLRVDSD